MEKFRNSWIVTLAEKPLVEIYHRANIYFEFAARRDDAPDKSATGLTKLTLLSKLWLYALFHCGNHFQHSCWLSRFFFSLSSRSRDWESSIFKFASPRFCYKVFSFSITWIFGRVSLSRAMVFLFDPGAYFINIRDEQFVGNFHKNSLNYVKYGFLE